MEAHLDSMMEELRICRETKAMLEAAFESAYEGIVVTDPQGTVRMLNETYARFLGVKAGDVIGKHVTEVVENTRMHIVAKTGKAELAQVQRIGEGDMVVHRIPIKQGGRVKAVVGKVLFQDVRELHALSARVLQLKQELDYYKGELIKHLGVKYGPTDITGTSPAIQTAKKWAERAALTDSTVLITGESGTGKELFAHSIHRLSHRNRGPFVKLNCAAIPDNLVESLLFGYTDGAFTGAVKGGRKGKFEMAHRGSIFLDEIGELSLPMQVKLLRVLQEKEVEPVGSVNAVKVDVRIIAATNRNLEEMVSDGEFREDLYYRLNVISLKVPPLRERSDDIPLLGMELMRKLSTEVGVKAKGISTQAMEALQAYHWPGNVRELKNVLERALHLVEADEIQLDHLPLHLSGREGTANRPVSLKDAVAHAEREALRHSLTLSGGDRNRAIQLLGISRSGFYQKLKKYGMDQE
ncbi:sigma-54 interaction domain-containing protein [Desmospora activa]|uniref:PAS domain S-box-containing protein n=1 Tax=Desmospora activa DSM 45169 TaxID=1121389 RepID=A0A2T4ZDG8_9BACL|nr:sigma 54-interacting transcriptional regulator [Desmospora activa]PTM59927.1 PAS domain S-box-containing protein [Desmospora activa DSM 45169]